jgi:glucokinase
MACYVGIEIGGTKLQVVLGDERGRIQAHRKLEVERHQGAAGIREQIERALPELSRGQDVSALGVGFGGPVDWRTGKICRSHQIEGWSEFDLGNWLQRLVGVPVRVDNDANVAALGEAHHGAGDGCNPVFYVTLGSGVGGGLVLDGNIYHGAKPGEAEIGHVRLDRLGTIVESRCSGWAVDRRIRELKNKAPDSLLARFAAQEERGEAKHLAAALTQGDRAARELLTEVAEDLAFGLSHVTHLFHPEVIVLGGGLSGVGEPLRAAVEQALVAQIMEAFSPGPKIVLSSLKEDAVPVGALELARDQRQKN